MKIYLAAAIALATLSTAMPASAGPIKNTWLRQEARIQNGFATGALTPGEYARLQGRQAFIAGEVALLRANGLSPVERGFIRAQQFGNSAGIFFHKHN